MPVELSDDFKALAARMQQLKGVKPVTLSDYQALVEMWRVLGDDFAKEGHRINAGMCHKNAERVLGDMNRQFRSVLVSSERAPE